MFGKYLGPRLEERIIKISYVLKHETWTFNSCSGIFFPYYLL
jgi:hypothetical protein